MNGETVRRVKARQVDFMGLDCGDAAYRQLHRFRCTLRRFGRWCLKALDSFGRNSGPYGPYM